VSEGLKTKESGFFFVLVLVGAAVLMCPSTQRFFFDLGERWAYVMALSFALSFCLTPAFRFLALHWNVVDSPDPRKVHQKATPLLGGAAVFCGFIVAILINDGIFSQKLIAILVGSGLLFLVGALDDFREIPASAKLLFQILATALVMGSGVVLRVLPNSLGPVADVSNMVLTVVWIVGITNAMNFFDGMDGLATGLGAIMAFFLGVAAFQTHQPFLGWIAVGVMGSCLGFLPYNFRAKKSASIFLGDGGSTFIGFILACLAVYGSWSDTSPVVALVSPLLIFWILIFDMAHITVDRIAAGKVLNFRQWLEYVGKDHMHHRLAEVLGGPRRTVLFIYLVSIALGISAVVLRNAGPLEAILLLLQASLIVTVVTVLERRGRRLNGTLETSHHNVIPWARHRERNLSPSAASESHVPLSTTRPASNR
jgi:UDP-GlcNAc:undecaprenyl-phosphate GlcNAc-1-phosphate transferase